MPVEVGAWIEHGARKRRPHRSKRSLPNNAVRQRLVAEVTQPPALRSSGNRGDYPAASLPCSRPQRHATALPPPEPVAQPVTAESPQPTPAPLRPDDQAILTVHKARIRRTTGRFDLPARDPATATRTPPVRATPSALEGGVAGWRLACPKACRRRPSPTTAGLSDADVRQWQHDWLSRSTAGRALGLTPSSCCGARNQPPR